MASRKVTDDRCTSGPMAFGIERIRMKHHAHAEHGGQAERAGETERMEKRQDAQEPVVAVQAKHLFHLLDVRADVVMAQHHALRFAGAAAGKNHRGQIIQPGFSFRAEQSLQATGPARTRR